MARFYLSAAIISACLVSLTACSNSQTLPKATTTTLPDHAKAAASAPKWSYEGKTGPEFWGDLEEAGACKLGEAQSPINIQQAHASLDAAPLMNYSKNAEIRIHDNGHTIVYTPTTPNNSITLNNERFELKQFHYHTPSEHQFNGHAYPAEMHFVHANSSGNLAVIGVMLNQGASNPMAQQLLNGSKLSAKNKTDFTVNGIDLNALIPAKATFYHYDGSLTTPPCSEQVQWFIANQPLALAKDQIAIMTNLYDGNNRPTQNQGSRTIKQLSN